MAIRATAWFILLILAAFQAWGSRHAMNPDGISYLDLARNATQGHLADTVNAYWSPMYPWLLACALILTGADAAWHFGVAHLTNFVLFVLALVAFDWFLMQLGVLPAGKQERPAGSGVRTELLLVFAYATFGVATLSWIGIANVTPDLLVAAIVLVASAFVLRINQRPQSSGPYWGLGLALGAGYLTKGAMLPLAAAFLAPLALRKSTRKGLRIALAAFTLIAAPYIAALSLKEGEFTTGEVAKLNYAWFVNDVPVFRHWQGGGTGDGTPRHPTRKLVDTPATYEFVGPVKGTYPVWYDPSYWHEGLELSFDVREQLDRALEEGLQLRWMFARLLWPLVALVVLATLGAVSFARSDTTAVLLPCVAAVFMYTAVHVEPRFLGGFVVVAFTVLTATMQTTNPAGRLASNALLVIAAAVFLATSARGAIVPLDDTPSDYSLRGANPHAVTAESLQKAGISAARPIGYIGNSFRAYWAYVGRFHIGAETRARDFWAADPASRANVLNAMRKAGITTVIADSQRGCLRNEGWWVVPKTHLCVFENTSRELE